LESGSIGTKEAHDKHVFIYSASTHKRDPATWICGRARQALASHDAMSCFGDKVGRRNGPCELDLRCDLVDPVWGYRRFDVCACGMRPTVVFLRHLSILLGCVTIYAIPTKESTMLVLCSAWLLFALISASDSSILSPPRHH
jgi:hypothetical protein